MSEWLDLRNPSFRHYSWPSTSFANFSHIQKENVLPSGLTMLRTTENDAERKACEGLDPKGFFIRHPPPPHELTTFNTPDDQLFQTIHMGAAIVDTYKYKLIVDGLVENPISLSLHDLKSFPKTTISAFHECYGSPLKPPLENVWRIGNVQWTGFSLSMLLNIAKPTAGAQFVWSEGLDFGDFGGVTTDRYQKDLPLAKAASPEVLPAYEMNGESLDRKRGGPVRLVVPGWFGTNSTKWLCRLSLHPCRAKGPFTTRFYNEVDPNDPNAEMRPVWAAEPNSMITFPESGVEISASEVEVIGWAWSHDGIACVDICIDGEEQQSAEVEHRVDFSWQKFRKVIQLKRGVHQLSARAKSKSGDRQPLSGRRNHVHQIEVKVFGL